MARKPAIAALPLFVFTESLRCDPFLYTGVQKFEALTLNMTAQHLSASSASWTSMHDTSGIVRCLACRCFLPVLGV